MDFLTASLRRLGTVVKAAFANETLWKSFHETGCRNLGTERNGEAVLTLQRAVEEARRIPDGGDREANSLGFLGWGLMLEKQFEAAEDCARKSLQLNEQAFGPDHYRVSQSLDILAGILRQQDRLAEAELFYRRSLKIVERDAGPDAPHVAVTLHNLAEISSRIHSFDDADHLYRRSLLIRQKVLPASHPDRIESLGGITALHLAHERFEHVECFLNEMRQELRSSQNAAPCWNSWCDHNSALVAQQVGNWETAEEIYRGQIGIASSEAESVYAIHNLGVSFAARGLLAEADILYQQTLDASDRGNVRDEGLMGACLNNRSRLLDDQRSHAEAEELCRRGLALRETAQHRSELDVVWSLDFLSEILFSRRNQSEGEAAFDRSQSIKRSWARSGDDNWTARILERAKAVFDAGKNFEARTLYYNARRVLERAFGPDDPKVADAIECYAESIRRLGKTDAADAFQRQAKMIRSQVT